MSHGRIELQKSHRPWPLPSGPWIMFQTWRDLLFAHWPIAHDVLRPLVPAELVLETYDGRAWLGLTPFRIADLHARYLPPLPGLANFPEMNLRTYVRVGDKPGIFFFSLDAANVVAVLAARLGYRLPYYPAKMEIESQGGWFDYRSRRTSGGAAAFIGRYRPLDGIREAPAGTLEHFLTERYALYAPLAGGWVLRGDIHHGPWPLQDAEATIEVNTVPAAHGIELPAEPPLLHFARRQDTLIWAPKPVRL